MRSVRIGSGAGEVSLGHATCTSALACVSDPPQAQHVFAYLMAEMQSVQQPRYAAERSGESQEGLQERLVDTWVNLSDSGCVSHSEGKVEDGSSYE